MNASFNHTDGDRPAPVFSRPRDMEPQRLSLNMLIVQMSRTIEHVLGPDIALEIECEQDLPPILGVSSLLTLAMIDLCSAARDTMQKGGRLLLKTCVKEVEQSKACRALENVSQEFVCLEVRHRGAGAAVEEKGSDKNGSGSEKLGAVYGIAQQHCGWLEVTRDAAETSFSLYFPVATRSETILTEDNSPIEIPGGHETILLVEDESDLLELTSEILERYGYRIITAPNGMAALKIWNERQDEIDLLLTDMRMPEGISGYELAERLLSDKPHLKVIFVSGYSIEPTSAALKLSEGENYLTKPYTPPGLAKAVRRMLDCVEVAEAA
jgi:two-component system cell cycle sensor histidine kinase/response regulator CckA